MKNEQGRRSASFDEPRTGGKNPAARGGNLPARMLWSAARTGFEFRGGRGKAAGDSGMVSAGEPAGRFAPEPVFGSATRCDRGGQSSRSTGARRGWVVPLAPGPSGEAERV